MNDSAPDQFRRKQAWQQLAQHYDAIKDLHMRDMFAADTERGQRLSLRLDHLLVDFSKHRITGDTLELLLELAEACAVEKAISALFAGEKINQSEDRAALHHVLRAPAEQVLEHNGTNVVSLVHEQLGRMEHLVKRLQEGEIRGPGGESISHVVNIGIGGSDLGPRLAIDALQSFANGEIEINFVSNLDPKELYSVLAKCDPQRTLFIVVSKTFTTLETMTNARAALSWLRDNGCQAPEQQVLAVTTNQAAARDFGVTDEHIFYFWDWVGGRYSLWSSVGLSIAIGVGMDNFRALLRGAHQVDEHFRHQAMAENIPVILALLSTWYNNFFQAESHAVIPYDQSLSLLPEYLSQLVMESNGKSTTRDAKPVDCSSSPIVWGTVGTNAQHAFFQMLHQGTHLVPVDFLLPLKNATDQAQQLLQVSNCLAQSEALMLGQEDNSDLNKSFTGNTPSTTFAYDVLDPETLGMLLAIYEHKTFVEAVIWNINPFDQWGVELGKKLAKTLIEEIGSPDQEISAHDASTQLLIKEYRSRNQS